MHSKNCPLPRGGECTCGGMNPVPPGLTVDGPIDLSHSGLCPAAMGAAGPCTCGAVRTRLAGGVIDGVMVKAVIFHITEPGVFALRYPNADHSGMWLERVDNKPGSATDENAATTEVRT